MKRLEHDPKVERGQSVIQVTADIIEKYETYEEFSKALIRKTANSMSLPSSVYIDLPRERR